MTFRDIREIYGVIQRPPPYAEDMENVEFHMVTCQSCGTNLKVAIYKDLDGGVMYESCSRCHKDYFLGFVRFPKVNDLDILIRIEKVLIFDEEHDRPR